MLDVSEVQNQLADLRDHVISLADFDRWIMSAGWNLHKKAPVDSRVYNVVRDIQGYLSEFQHGEYSESELRSELWSLLPMKPIRCAIDFDPAPEPEPAIVMSVTEKPRWIPVPELVLAEL